MKFLLVITMLVGSVFANAAANGESAIKCYEKDGHELELAYIIKVDHDDVESINRRLELLDCTRGHDDVESANCRNRGNLRKVERQEESCLVLSRHDFNNDGFSLCREEQDFVNPRLVPVTVTDDRQEQRIYCEREILRVL